MTKIEDKKEKQREISVSECDEPKSVESVTEG